MAQEITIMNIAQVVKQRYFYDRDDFHKAYGKNIPADHKRHPVINLDIRSGTKEPKIIKMTNRLWK